MKDKKLTAKKTEAFKSFLTNEEKSAATIDKYMRDLRTFKDFIAEKPINKQLIMEYKKLLGNSYAVASANSMIAALNSFFRFCGWYELCIKQFRVQKPAFCSEEKELSKAEYFRLLEASRKSNNERLNLIIQTICSTGIRVSELEYVTVEALYQDKVTVDCKNKTRHIFIISELKKRLIKYAQKHGITAGPVFVTRSGKPISRSNIWREMKGLCEQARVSPNKVFPHNLRHLFARTFYSIEKDIAKLADILGHTNINTTRIYIITTGAEHKRKMENLRLIS